MAGFGISALALGVGGMLVDILAFGNANWWVWHRALVMFVPPAAVTFWSYRSMQRLRMQNYSEQVAAADAVQRLSADRSARFQTTADGSEL